MRYRILHSIAGALFILFSCYLTVRPSFALDPPHNSIYQITCGSLCHSSASPPPSWKTQPTGTPTIDFTTLNNMCWACHTPAYPGPGVMKPEAQYVQTHSSVMTSNTYGTWSIECRVCHLPHFQQQIANYPSTTLNSVVTGTILSVSPTNDSITVSAALTPGAYVDYMLVPNMNYPYDMYYITSNDANTISITNVGNVTFDTYSVQPNVAFAIRYARLVRDPITTPSSGVKTVRFFNNQGPNSFASGTSPVDGVCQVCHTRTKYFNTSGTRLDQGHPAPPGVNCTKTCHQHKDGFKPTCDQCHGRPPVTKTIGGAEGLATYGTGSGGTGSTTPGAHRRHALSLGYSCQTCHTGYTMPDDAGRTIDIGFSIFGSGEGSYDGQKTATYTGRNNTTVGNQGSKTCSSVYCHGASMAPNGGTDITPIWDDPSTTICGSCHGATAANPPTRGSHKKHVQSPPDGRHYPCSMCHKDPSADNTLHVNNKSEVVFSTDPLSNNGVYSGTPDVLDAYGACTNLYCHSTAQGITDPTQPPVYAAPVWGGHFTGICGNGACHGVGYAHPGIASGFTPLTSGSHSAHLRYPFDQEANCQACHYNSAYAGCDSCHARQLDHVDHRIDVAFNPSFPAAGGGASGSYSGDSIPQTPYGACSALYCHSQGTKSSPPYSVPNTSVVSWGGQLPEDCTGCHNNDRNSAFVMRTGSHGKHVASSGYDCSACHAATVKDSRTLNQDTYLVDLSFGYRNHANGWVNVAFSSNTASAATYAGKASPVNDRAPGASYGACANISCHGDGTSVSTGIITTNATPVWGSTSTLACISCHGYPPAYAQDMPKANSHQYHTGYFTCNYCHYATTLTGSFITNATNHANGVYDVIPDTSMTYTAYFVTKVNFNYTYYKGGGQCTNITCHQAQYIGTSAYWGGVWISPAAGHSYGPGCYEVQFSASATGGTTPYTYAWDFADSSTSTQQNVDHLFATGGTYTVTLSAWDAKGHEGTTSQTIIPQSVNAAPVSAASSTVHGFTVTVTDLSYDPDYNQCGHSGDGNITFYWGDGTTTTQQISLTNIASNLTYTHTYPTPNAGTYTIQHIIRDNSGYQVQSSNMKATLPTTTTVSGRIVRADSTPVSSATVELKYTNGTVYKNAYTDSQGNYTFTNVAEDLCYIAQPKKTGMTFSPAAQNICTLNGAVTNVNFIGSP